MLSTVCSIVRHINYITLHTNRNISSSTTMPGSKPCSYILRQEEMECLRKANYVSIRLDLHGDNIDDPCLSSDCEVDRLNIPQLFSELTSSEFHFPKKNVFQTRVNNDILRCRYMRIQGSSNEERHTSISVRSHLCLS